MRPLPDITERLPVTAGTTLIRVPEPSMGTSAWSSLLLPASIELDLSVLDDGSGTRADDILVFWHNDPLTAPYDHTIRNLPPHGIPAAYVIEGRTRDGAGEHGWKTLAGAAGNRFSSAQHVVDVRDVDRLRITFTEAADGSGVTARIHVHEVYEVVEDSWAFYGDSITEAALDHGPRGIGTWATLVNAVLPDHTPVQQCCGIGGITAARAAQEIDGWLAAFPGRYAVLAFGTNDLNRADPRDVYVGEEVARAYETLVDAVLAAGKVPIVPTIPWGTTPGVSAHGPSANGLLAKVVEARPAVVAGPDLWGFLRDRPELCHEDGFHPNLDGYAALRRLWAETMLVRVYGH